MTRQNNLCCIQTFFTGAFMRILGIVIFVVGLVILGFGINSSQALGEKVVENLSGRFTANTMWYIIGGIALIVGGGALTFFGDNK
jgi:ABC-type dipeptide/oligopeptide/nickel transport system permease subunit